jgi:hypothetical protein
VSRSVLSNVDVASVLIQSEGALRRTPQVGLPGTAMVGVALVLRSSFRMRGAERQ